MNKGAGVLLISPKGNTLFLRRTATAPDFPGAWDLPGGGVEGDESTEDAARRECLEETGYEPKGTLTVHTRTRGNSAADPNGGVGIGAPTVSFPESAGAPVAGVPMPVLPDVEFTTFFHQCDEEFIPELNDEHDGYAWSPASAPPQPIHPGTQIALDRLTMNELGVARAIATGRLVSPQKYENVWLWAIRISGTDVAFRPGHDEFAVRRAENWLTPEALARCNGLPVIWKHPPKRILDSDEFGNRVVGTIFLPYVAGDETWGIAKVFDDDVNEAMQTENLSTSPGVNFKDFSVNARLTLENGKKVLVEGDPSLFDHVAICELGVWDKDGEPTGIRSEAREDSAMPDTEKKDDARKDDSDLDKKLSHIADSLGKISDRLDAVTKRMDAVEEKEREDSRRRDDAKRDDRKDAKRDDRRDDEKRDDEHRDDRRRDDAKRDDEEDKDEDEDEAKKPVADRKDAKRDDRRDDRRDDDKRDDAKRDDADEDEKKEEREDRRDAKRDDARDDRRRDDERRDDRRRDDARDDSVARADIDDIRKRIEQVATSIPKSIGDADYTAVIDAQARADDVFSKFGDHAPRPLNGETAGLYERRVVRALKKHSRTWGNVDLTTAMADDASFNIVRDQVYAEAGRAALDPANIPGGQLRMVTRREGGHEIREFHGSPNIWMNPLAGNVQLKATGAFKDSSIRH